MNTKPESDWILRRVGKAWRIHRDGVPYEGAGAPAGLVGIREHLNAMTGEVLDLGDVGVASTRNPSGQEYCVVSGRRVGNPRFGTALDARARPGEWQACVFAPNGRRWFLHMDATELLAPCVAAALASYANLPAPQPPTDGAQWRRNVALNLLARAFGNGPESSPLLSAWATEQAVRLLTAREALVGVE